MVVYHDNCSESQIEYGRKHGPDFQATDNWLIGTSCLWYNVQQPQIWHIKFHLLRSNCYCIEVYVKTIFMGIYVQTCEQMTSS